MIKSHSLRCWSWWYIGVDQQQVAKGSQETSILIHLIYSFTFLTTSSVFLPTPTVLIYWCVLVLSDWLSVLVVLFPELQSPLVQPLPSTPAPHPSNFSSKVLVFFNLFILLFSNSAIIWNCYVYNFAAFLPFVNDHQVRPFFKSAYGSQSILNGDRGFKKKRSYCT